MKVEIYSDVACPWCYIGKARFERALAAFPGEVEVEFRPYQLDPGAPREAEPMLDYLERRFGASARAMADRVVENARGDGLVMDYDRGLAANTLPAHRLMDLAEREHGPAVQRDVAERLFRAHFAEGKDIGDAEVLSALAADAGMDRDRVREYLESGEGEDAVRARIADAQEIGISAVPTFVFEGKYAVQGAQPASTFLQVLEAVAKESAAADAEGSSADDACAEGACSV